MRLCQDLPSRLCRLLFILTLLLAWCQGPSLRAQTTGDAGVGTGVGTGREPTADDFKDFVVRFEKFLDAVEKADGELPRDSFDLASVVAEAGKDPQALLAWVRDHTAWVPYAGALRGAAGTLMDRVGNSLDRALCLAELLRAAGHSARLATATLTDEQARALRGRLAAEGARTSTREQAATDAAAWDRAIEQEAAKQRVDPQQFRRDVEKLIAPVNKMAEQLAQRVAEQVPALTQALDVGAQPGAGRIAEDPAERELTALRDHWWVQLRQGGSWVDLDPMPPEVQNGLRPMKTVDLAKDPGKLPLAAAECHEVTITVVAEQWKDGKLREAPALKHTFRPAEVLGQRVVLSHVPLDWPGDLNLASAAAPAARVEELMLGQREWVPMLQVGETTVIQSGVTTAGAIDPKPALDAMA